MGLTGAQLWNETKLKWAQTQPTIKQTGAGSPPMILPQANTSSTNTPSLGTFLNSDNDPFNFNPLTQNTQVPGTKTSPLSPSNAASQSGQKVSLANLAMNTNNPLAGKLRSNIKGAKVPYGSPQGDCFRQTKARLVKSGVPVKDIMGTGKNGNASGFAINSMIAKSGSFEVPPLTGKTMLVPDENGKRVPIKGLSQADVKANPDLLEGMPGYSTRYANIPNNSDFGNHFFQWQWVSAGAMGGKTPPPNAIKNDKGQYLITVADSKEFASANPDGVRVNTVYGNSGGSTVVVPKGSLVQKLPADDNSNVAGAK